MKKLFTIIMLAMLAVIIKPDTASASHIAGADITYTYTGNPNEYLIRLKLYRDCTGIQFGNAEPICFESASLGINGTLNLNLVTSNFIGSATCVLTPTNACSTTPASDTEERIYEGVILLAGAATDWRFSWSSCCRNPTITTLVDPDLQGLIVSTDLNNLDAPTNSSPSFAALAYTRFCVGNAFYYDQSATDIDGDSLVFSLVDAEENGSFCPVSYTPLAYTINTATGIPYSGIEPFASAVPFTIDPNTGIVYFIPTQVQVGVMVVLVKEFRNGIQIGQVERDIQINIIASCVQLTPSFLDAVVSTNGGSITASCNDYSVVVPFDTLFQCGSAVPTDFRSVGPFGIPNPIVAVNPINCFGGKTDSMEVVFLNPLTVGTTKLFVKTGFDGNTLLSECGSSMAPGVDTINVVVTDNSVWSPIQDSVGCLFNDFVITLSDSVYCFSIANDGTDLQLVDAAGINYPIANAYGSCNPSGLKANQLLVEMASNTSSVGPFYLLINPAGGSDGNTIANDCGRFLLATDTLAVLYVDNVIPVNLGSDQTLCEFQTPYVLNSGYTGINYQWSDGNGVIPGATFDTLIVSASGTYIVNLNSSPSCSGSDTIVITVIPSPSDNLPADFAQCNLDPLPLLDAGNVGSTYQWYLNTTIITGATSQTYQPTVAGTYSVIVDNGSSSCVGTFEVVITGIAPYSVALTDANICANGTYPLLDAGNPGATYQWFQGGTAISGATSQTYQTTTAGTYSVEVGTGTCKGTASMNLVVTSIPVVSLSNQTLCDVDPITPLDAGNPGASYQWFQNGTAISGETSQTYTPTTAGTYSVDVTVSPGCTSSASMQLTVNASPVFTLTDASICNDGNTTLDPGIAGATYSWSNGATSQTITVNEDNTYIVTVTQNGCVGRDTADVTVFDYPSAPIVGCVVTESGTYKYIYSWAAITGAVSYEVSFDNGVTWIPSNQASGVETHGTNTSAPGFLVRAIGGGLCKIGEESIPSYCPISIPNIITPNGDGKNDVFIIDNIDQYPTNTVQIFSRWGKEVFTADGYNNGTKRFIGTDLPEGVYFYIINLNDGKEPRTGTVTINR
jgi:gliding motility-associated-like protein